MIYLQSCYFGDLFQTLSIISNLLTTIMKLHHLFFVLTFFLLLPFIGCKQKEASANISIPNDIISKPPKGWVALFNGENLDNWSFSKRDTTYTNDVYSIFSIEDGVIHVYPNQEHNSEQTFAGIITKKSYSKYLLSLEYKWGENKFKPRHEFVRDAGVLFHVHGEDVIWPNSVECQIQEGDTGDIWAINTQVSSKVNATIRNYSTIGELVTRGGIDAPKFHRFHRGYDWEVPHGEWNKLEIEVNGENAKYTLNGKVVNEALNMKYYDKHTNTALPLTKGKILLQAEGAELYYRNIFIKEK